MKPNLIIAAAILLTLSVQAQRTANISDPRLQIKLPSVSGDTLSLSSLKGKVVLLDFWASWCGPCRSANKELARLYGKYKSKGLEIFSVSVDDSKKNWEKAIARDKMTWLQVNEPKSWSAESAMRWNVNYLPTTFLINKKGDVVAVEPALRDLDKLVEQLLQE